MIYVMDELTVRPGKLQQFTSRFAEAYVPGAEARGLRLIGSWTPAAESDGEASRVIVLWSLDSPQAFWRQKHKSAQDPKVNEWWREADDYLVSRARKYMHPAAFSPMQ